MFDLTEGRAQVVNKVWTVPAELYFGQCNILQNPSLFQGKINYYTAVLFRISQDKLSSG